MKIIVAQHGSRHRYAIPQLLDGAGLLDHLYTDSNAFSGLGRLAGILTKRMHVSALSRLSERVPNLSGGKLCCTDLPFWVERLFPLWKSPEKYRFRHRVLSKKMIGWGVDGADAVYSMYDESLDFLKYAREQGKEIFIDVFIAPDSDYLVARYSGRSCCKEDFYNPELSECLQYADHLVCPSEFVARGVREFYPQYAEKICLCPYGSSITYDGAVNQPVAGRFFWAGGDPVRKGLPLLAAAARNVLKKHPSAEFRVAGITDPEILHQEEYKGLHFLGKLDRVQMKEEFLAADAFVLPTVAEGMASVCVEALAAGCPIIVPPSAGIDPVNGEFGGILLNGLSEPELSEALCRIIENREERSKLAETALRVSRNYSMEAWKQRLQSLFIEK